ncbi:hypothetical protein B0T26DRAFT_680961 [Lasiosphaeria miniovina]|uniref:Uncharacterized protein n=1 Tax=Lasiosphaeria miniovina TaxID=1954250 RepID=A0AA39ZTB9_9PEZI|nr:uncharacterized protein B0T26DRAFT_680961 [Lasiosphaeria miniovina]KAK0703257.1 hypothetical protein B0T26DRAFT_680961 [Lasiosphaeria miniovina]
MSTAIWREPDLAKYGGGARFTEPLSLRKSLARKTTSAPIVAAFEKACAALDRYYEAAAREGFSLSPASAEKVAARRKLLARKSKKKAVPLPFDKSRAEPGLKRGESLAPASSDEEEDKEDEDEDEQDKDKEDDGARFVLTRAERKARTEKLVSEFVCKLNDLWA